MARGLTTKFYKEQRCGEASSMSPKRKVQAMGSGRLPRTTRRTTIPISYRSLYHYIHLMFSRAFRDLERPYCKISNWTYARRTSLGEITLCALRCFIWLCFRWIWKKRRTWARRRRWWMILKMSSRVALRVSSWRLLSKAWGHRTTSTPVKLLPYMLISMASSWKPKATRTSRKWSTASLRNHLSVALFRRMT